MEFNIQFNDNRLQDGWQLPGVAAKVDNKVQNSRKAAEDEVMNTHIPDEFNQQEKKLARLWDGQEGTGISSREITDQITGPVLRLVSDHRKPRRYKARRCRKRRDGADEGTRTPEYRNHNPGP